VPVLFGGLSRGAFGISDPGALSDDGMTSVQGVMIKNAFFREILDMNIGMIIRSIDTPTLVIHGMNDTVVPA